MENGIDQEFVQDKLQQIKERVHRTSLYISEVSENVKTRFKELAKREFKDDYGLLLKWLLDMSEGLFADKNEEINVKLDILAEEVNKLKARLDELEKEPENPKRKMVSGKEF